MEFTEAKIGLEYIAETASVVSATELLQNPMDSAEAWPIEAITPSFLEQIAEHEQRMGVVGIVLDSIPEPTMTLEEALAQGHVTIQQAKELYGAFSSLLIDKDYARLVLYLPFELLPNRSWMPADEPLQVAIDGFRQSYIAAWGSLLTVQDVRANFVDGDVLETSQRTTDLPRVVKAAHLLPGLVACGMISPGEAVELLECTEDPTLRSSVLDSLAVLSDMGLLTDSDEQRIPGLKDPATTQDPIPDAVNSPTERRTAWLTQKREDETIATLAEQLSEALATENLSPEALEQMLASHEPRIADQIHVEAILRAVYKTAQANEDAFALYDRYKEQLLSFWDKDDIPLRERFTKTYRHLYRLGIIDEQQLTDLGIVLPDLAGPLSKNAELLPQEIDQLKQIAILIEQDPELATYVYPVIAMGGSRLKGYGEQSSDMDASIFIKPNAPEAIKDQLRVLLRTALESVNYHEKPTEFWLDDVDGELTVRDLSDNDPLVADKYWTHVLFGTIWIGKTDAVSELREKLLPAYFYDTNTQIDGPSDRSFFLERLEQDMLQYRLMHKGYARHYPRLTSVNVPHAHMIDGDSVFWDAGYRRLATRLFINQVFLPKIT